MGCCCGKKKTETDPLAEGSHKESSSGSSKKKKIARDPTAETLKNIEEYSFNSGRDEWKLTEVKESIEQEAIDHLKDKVDFENPTLTPPANMISNVVLFDTKTGSEIYKKALQKPAILTPTTSDKDRKSSKRCSGSKDQSRGAKDTSGTKKTSKANKDPAGEQKSTPPIKGEIFKTTVDGVEKVAVVFASADPVKKEEVQQMMSDFMENLQAELPQVFSKKAIIQPTVSFAVDSGRPLKANPDVPRREIVQRPLKKIDYKKKFAQQFAKYFEPGPGHFTLPESPNIDYLPGFCQVKPGWLHINNVFYFVILIERSEGEKYLKRLINHPATSVLSDDTQGDFFQCEYVGLEMLGIRLFHAKNQIQKIDRAQRILLMDHMKEVSKVAIHTDIDFRDDPFDIEKCCERLEIDDDLKRQYLLAATY